VSTFCREKYAGIHGRIAGKKRIDRTGNYVNYKKIMEDNFNKV
jgi:hypothetical protein